MIATIQIILSVAIIILILLQQRSAGITGLLGSGDGGAGYYQTRRGMERIVFRATIVLAVIFAALALYQLVRS